MNLGQILEKFKGVRRSGSDWAALCPAHADRSPSLSVSERDGKVLLHCHAGCRPEDICAAVGLGLHDLFTPPQIVAVYDYRGEDGSLLFQVLRNEPKSFCQRRPDGHGGWVWNLNGTRRVLYRLSEVLKADFLLVPEGEKDVETARKLGFVATCNPGGAGKWRGQYSEFLRGKGIAIIADADEPGRKHAQQVASSLHGKAEGVKVLELPGAKDLSEFVEKVDNPAIAKKLILAAIADVPEWRLEASRPAISPWTAEPMHEFLTSRDSSAEALHDRLVYRETITEMFSPRGVGKSLFAHGIAVDGARRGLRILILDRDNPRRIVRERLRDWGADEGLGNLKVITREKCPALTNAAAWAEFPCSEYDLVIVDALDAMAEGIGEQDSARPSRAIAPLLDVARREGGPGVLVLGNCVKSAQHSRGSGVIEDRADIVYEVRDATDFRPTGKKPWIEELPDAGAANWAARSARRKGQEVYRLAFVPTKFRIGEEPEPFAIEIDTTTKPWSFRDVTDDIDREGAAERERQTHAKVIAIQLAVDCLKAEIQRRQASLESPMLKTQGVDFLASRGIKRKVAREAIASNIFTAVPGAGPGHPKTLQLAVENDAAGGNNASPETSSLLGFDSADFRRARPEHTAEITPSQEAEFRKLAYAPISAEGFIYPARQLDDETRLHDHTPSPNRGDADRSSPPMD